ncbi:MAG: PDDEXK nuclease domain-containing protein [Chitinophagales bacterium]|nr:DUF1016 family protein [Bacteroidota bacterium]MCB9225796.1 DUF1016 domain-containing protein [Chitinophagales bacterium]
MKSELSGQHKKLFLTVKELIQQARQQVVRNVNQVMVTTYYEIGRMIVEEEQQGNKRADYGKEVIANLSKELTKEFEKGFTTRYLELMRKFYITYSKTKSVISEFKLSWTHYIRLIRVEDENERKFYEIESINNNWSVRELNRQFDTALYQRLALSRDKEGIKKLNQKGQILEKPKDIIKEPYVLEFLGLKEDNRYSESDLETAIIDKLEYFLLELGKGFAFIGRQKRISINNKHFFIDLVFYNRILKCFLLIDLKIGELKHQDLGQMLMYVHYYDRDVKLEDENPTIGLVLCSENDKTIVEYTLPKDNKQIFASQYKTVLPSKKKLQQIINDSIE